jgi:demethylmenaquinone methyltransferase/2-methoxy-6-polyprenyl-1,4-benzoquinol methylase
MIAEGERKERSVRAMFGRIAPRYDLLNALLSMGLDRSWRLAAVKAANPPEGGKCLDCCAGTGELAFLLAEAVGRKGEVVGLDFCPEMLELAREKLKTADMPQLRFESGSVLDIPFPDGYFDAVTMAFGLRNLADPGKAFAQIRRVLRPGGRAVNLELTLPTGTLLRFLYYPYLVLYLPLVGAVLSGSLSAYRYLAGSIRRFFSREEVAACMEGTGLKEVRWFNLCGGVATIHTGLVSKD